METRFVKVGPDYINPAQVVAVDAARHRPAGAPVESTIRMADNTIYTSPGTPAAILASWGPLWGAPQEN